MVNRAFHRTKLKCCAWLVGSLLKVGLCGQSSAWHAASVRADRQTDSVASSRRDSLVKKTSTTSRRDGVVSRVVRLLAKLCHLERKKEERSSRDGFAESSHASVRLLGIFASLCSYARARCYQVGRQVGFPSCVDPISAACTECNGADSRTAQITQSNSDVAQIQECLT